MDSWLFAIESFVYMLRALGLALPLLAGIAKDSLLGAVQQRIRLGYVGHVPGRANDGVNCKRDFYRTLTPPRTAAKRLLNGGEVERQQISNVRAAARWGNSLSTCRR